MITGYSDADYAADINNRRSTSGYIFVMSEGSIPRCPQRQKLVTVSTTDSKYVSASEASTEASRYNQSLQEIGYRLEGINIKLDNQSVIKLIKNKHFYYI